MGRLPARLPVVMDGWSSPGPGQYSAIGARASSGSAGRLMRYDCRAGLGEADRDRLTRPTHR